MIRSLFHTSLEHDFPPVSPIGEEHVDEILSEIYAYFKTSQEVITNRVMEADSSQNLATSPHSPLSSKYCSVECNIPCSPNSI